MTSQGIGKIDTVRLLETVFVTEGVPNETFVLPSNFNEILVDMRRPGKPVIIEGPSGIGKTCTAKKILEHLGKESEWMYLSCRKPNDISLIRELSENPSSGVFILDDFHRLPSDCQEKISDIAKIAAEEFDSKNHPKLILIGINQVGESLIKFSPDIAKRCGIHKISPASKEQTVALVENGSKALNILIKDVEKFYKESRGDYWLTQNLCKTLCNLNGITETQEELKEVVPDFDLVRKTIVGRLEPVYYDAVKDFCRGARFRPSNDPYFRILQFIATKSEDSNVDLIELANAYKEIAGSINNVKDKRLSILLSEKQKASQYFYYNKDTARFSIEDPAMFYFIKNLDWDKARRDCGFREKDAASSPRYDVAISFAGENRAIAQHIAESLEKYDIAVYFDENHETELLGKSLGEEFEEVFSRESRFVVALLDKNHLEKDWPTFERDVFIKRVRKMEIIPIYLDETVFPCLPSDVYGIKVSIDVNSADWKCMVDERVVRRLIEKMQ